VLQSDLAKGIFTMGYRGWPEISPKKMMWEKKWDVKIVQSCWCFSKIAKNMWVEKWMNMGRSINKHEV
jgi:hypothetical protein